TGRPKVAQVVSIHILIHIRLTIPPVSCRLGRLELAGWPADASRDGRQDSGNGGWGSSDLSCVSQRCSGFAPKPDPMVLPVAPTRGKRQIAKELSIPGVLVSL